jgi:redox-sensitive bicupin YhaK (pirin superfamily)
MKEKDGVYMKKCRIIKEIRGQRAVDGAGVRLVRVLGSNDVKAFDPFLMLDSFDSLEASDYVAGFPMHPHRGIETITYLISGEIEHQDSLGNEGTIRSGEAQWMTAGSGILHQEMPQKSERMLGFQLWLNLPSEKKMTAPSYLSIIKDEIALKCVDGAEIRVLSGSFEEVSGITSRYLPATIYDILVFKGSEINIPVKSEETAFIFLIEGDAWVEEKRVLSKTAVLFDKGESITVMAPPDSDSRFIFFSGKPLQEPISWGGPIVMNTQEELNCAFDELREGTFIKHK